MSAFTGYAAHAELVAAVHANDDAEMLADLHTDMPDLCAYPVSGDMLATIHHGSPHQRRQRRRLAAAGRRQP